MAGQDHLLSRIAALVAGFDDASWEALASKGLLRRARKDMEKGVSAEVGESVGDTLNIKVQAFTVSMPASGPAKATCSCPAPGICQHILIARPVPSDENSLSRGKTCLMQSRDYLR